MTNTQLQYADEIFISVNNEPAVHQIVCTKGNIKRIYNNVKTWDLVQEIIDRRTSEGFEVKVI